MRAKLIRVGFIGLVSALLTVCVFAQGRGGGARGGGGGARGEAGQGRGARGERGGAGEVAEQRKAVQASQKAALAAENASFRAAMQSIQSNARNAKDDNAKSLARLEMDSARRNHQSAIQQIRSQGAAAMAALKK